MRAQDDFNLYSNGKWLKEEKIPDEYSTWGTFTELLEENNNNVRKVIETISQKTKYSDSIEQKIGDFWKSANNKSFILQEYIPIIKNYYHEIDNCNTKLDIVKCMAQLQKENMTTLFSIFSGPDSKNSNWCIGHIYSSGINLPDRDYYLKKENKTILLEYSKFIENINQILISDGIGMSGKQELDISKHIIDLETKLAKNKLSRVEMRDSEKTYNKYQYSDLIGLNGKFNWNIYLKELHLDNQPYFIVDNPIYLQKIGSILYSTKLDIWKLYLKWTVILHFSKYIPNKLNDLYFKFFGTTLSGQKKQKTYWKKIVQWSNHYIGELVGQKYIEQYFSKESKEKILDLVSNIKNSFKNRLLNVDWMEDETKKKALEKLSKFNVKMGYPDKWIDYSSLEINSKSLLLNIINCNKFDILYEINQMNLPVDKHKWEMTPQTINAYFHPEMNEIVFPAGILQPPFFSIKQTDSQNYGGIGAVIGHEITHGYDDQGRKYDGNGNLVDWWSLQDMENFNHKTKQIVEQFNNCLLLNTPVNGELTQGENIADLGGLVVAYESLSNLPDFNKQKGQEFFKSWSRIWRTLIRDEELLLRLKIDPHSPGELRINMPLSNMIAFYEAFDVKSGDKMYRTDENRIKIW